MKAKGRLGRGASNAVYRTDRSEIRFLEKSTFKKVLKINGLPDGGIWSFRIRLLASVASG
jgi:hypothetical protein